MSGSDLIAQAQQYLMHTYAPQPVLFSKGRGTRLYDTEGKEYLDFVGGIAVNNLGHCHPIITLALQKQAQRLVHVSNLYYSEPMIQLAKVLVEYSFADKIFFCNSGAEANEAAIKLVRKYAHARHGNHRYEILCMEQSFHGRTLAMITATGQEKYQKGFEPLPSGFRHIPFNDLKTTEAAITDKTAAIMVEPIQGEGGVRVPDQGYLEGLRKLCDDQDLLLVFDEVQTGIGRTGKLFAYEHWGMEPDIMTLAKGLGAGVPIGAMLAKEAIAQSFTPGSHASTFGGNPLASQTALVNLEVLLEKGFILENCRQMGDYFIQQLQTLKTKHPCILAVRGMGLLVGAELSIDGKPVVDDCRDAGVLINCVMGKVLRFVPALMIMKEEIDQLIELLDQVLDKRGRA